MSFTESQQMAYDAMMSGENVFLTGEAGTGKSYVIQEFIKEKKKDVLVCAPTGIAAINVGGITLHKAFRLPLGTLYPNVRIKARSVVEAAKTIIIDEISMCKIDTFSVISYILRRTKKHKQLIVVGDFFQLPPVLTDREKDFLYEKWGNSLSEEYTIDDLSEPYAFLSKNWKTFNFRTIVLTEQVRQRDDLQFLNALNKIRVGDEAGISWIMRHSSPTPKQGAIYLCGRNDVVSAKNQECLNQLKTVPKQYISEISGDINESDSPAEKVLTLKKDCRVMALVNDNEDKQYVNGSLGTVKDLGDDYVIVDFDNGNKGVTVGKYTWTAKDYKSEEKVVKEYRLEKGRSKRTGLVNLSPWKVAADGERLPTDTVTEDGRALVRTVTKKSFSLIPCGSITQIPLKLAYAVTIHKSQGQTYDSVTLNPHCFAPGQLYVALSRVRKITDLYLEGRIKYSDLQTSYAVKEFYSRIQGDNEKELFLPSYAVSSEEMKEFKAWWAKILKQRKITGQNMQEGNRDNIPSDDKSNKDVNTPESLRKIGDSYYLKMNYDKAIKYYKDAAEQGDAVAQNILGFMYENGRGVPENYEVAMEWYQKAEEQGHEDALADVAHLKVAGSNLLIKNDNKNKPHARDCDEALKSYINAAKQGDPSVQRDLGYKYQYGKGVPQDYAEAMKWYRKAAEQDYSIALNDLGCMYYNGKGVPQNFAEAAKWFKKAAEQGESVAQYNLGNMYRDGKGVPQDYAMALRWYRKASAQDYSLAITALGYMYEYGKGVPQDYVEAARLYRKAADKDCSSAQRNLGYMYESGKGVPKYYPEALVWYRKAAEQGDSIAQRNLGNMYRDGKGVPQDYAEALEWYRKATEQGNADALADIGYMYECGKGVNKNITEAIAYYLKAARKGNSYAKERVKMLTSKTTS